MHMGIKVYGANWCADCRNVKDFLDTQKIEYQYIDISKNDEAIFIVEKINKGKRIIPTLIVNGITYSNPSINRLKNII